MDINVMMSIGIKFHQRMWTKKYPWKLHPLMVSSYLYHILVRILGETDEDQLNYYSEICEKIAWGHDILKQITSSITVREQGKDYSVIINQYPYIHPKSDELFSWVCGTQYGASNEQIQRFKKDLIDAGKGGNYHGLNAAGWLYEYGEDDPYVLIPIMLHQGNVASLYQFIKSIDPFMTRLIECTILADKLASNYLKAMLGKNIQRFLHRVLYGETGNEFNYSQALYTASVMKNGKSPNTIQEEGSDIFRGMAASQGLFVPYKNSGSTICLGPKYRLSEEEQRIGLKVLEVQYGFKEERNQRSGPGDISKEEIEGITGDN